MQYKIIKITFVVMSLRSSGPTSQLKYIVSALLKECRDIEISIISLRKERNSTKEAEFKRIPNLKLHLVKRRKDFYKNILKITSNESRVVFSSGVLSDMVCFLFVHKKKWVPIIRSHPIDDYVDKFGRVFGWVLSQTIIRVYRKSVSAVTISEFLKIRLRQLGIETKVIRNSIPFSGIRLSSHLECGRIFLIIGNLRKLKNIGEGIELFKHLQEKGDVLHVLGDGPMREDLQKGYSHDDSIIFHGHVEHIAKFYNKADCLISLSLSEGMPNTVLESISWGVPCILSPIYAHKELKGLFLNSIYIYNSDSDKGSINAFIKKTDKERALMSAQIQKKLGLSRLSSDYVNLISSVSHEKSL